MAENARTMTVNIVQLDGGFSDVSDSDSEAESNSEDIDLLTDTSTGETTEDNSDPNEDEDDDYLEEESQILVVSRLQCSMYHQDPPPAWYDKYVPTQHSKKRNVKTIKRDNKFEKVETLPVISVPNTRSLFPKIRNFVNDMRMRDINLAICSETWHREDKKRHRNEVERLLLSEGLKFLSAPRPGGKRGGGCGIIADMTHYTLDKIEITNEHKLEVCWGILRPKQTNCAIKEYVVCALYCPPNSRKKEKLVTHIVVNAHKLMTKYPNCGMLIGGDKNSLNIAPILQALPRFRQVVVGNTHKEKCLDILITNCHLLYQPVVIAPPCQPDDPAKAKPSDHLVPVLYPISGASGAVSRTYEERTSRPMPDSAIRQFGQWLASQDWSVINEDSNPDEMLACFDKLVEDQMKENFPEKKTKTTNQDLPFFDWKLKTKKRRLQRIYRKEGKSEKYKRMKTEYDALFLKSSKSYIQQNVDQLKEVNPAKAAAILKKLGGAPGDCGDKGDFVILSHQAANLTPQQCTDKLLTYFTDISKEYPPLDITTLPVRVKVKLLERGQRSPTVEDYQVYEAIKKAKKPRSTGVPGDLPKKILSEFPVELAAPVGKIFRRVLETNVWPRNWTLELGLALKKSTTLPETESQTRVISLTAFWSKCLEGFVIDWLFQAIGHKIDFSQYGGLKGHSTSHYLIDLVNFVLYNQDLSDPHATLGVMYDFEKAFNRQEHNKLIVILSDLGTPGWLLKIVMAFLTDRRMILKYKGCESREETLPGGGPQGTKLGLFLFLILINSAGYKPNKICQKLGEKVTSGKRKPILQSQEKYIDDMTQLAAINVKKATIMDPNPNPVLPRQFHERTNHILPNENNPLQNEIEKLKKYAEENGMKINQEKTKVMLFNRATKTDFLPQLEISEGKSLEVVEEMKLLGIMIRSDLRWTSNTNLIISKCYKRIWMLRRLKHFGASEDNLLEVYIQQIRSITEMACPVWNGGLTQLEVRAIERLQKVALAIILGDAYSTYNEALNHFNVDSLEARREHLCLQFAIKAYKNPKFNSWFEPNQTTTTRSGKNMTVLKEVICKKTRFKMSPIPYLTHILNMHLTNLKNNKQTEWKKFMSTINNIRIQG